MPLDNEDELLREVALRNSAAVLRARQAAEEALIERTRELAESVAMMKATLDASTDGILVTDHAGRVTAFNTRFTQVWGLEPESLGSADHRALLGRMASLVSHPEAFAARVQAIYADAPATTFDLLELSNGMRIERQSRPQVVDGVVVGRVWTYRDITEYRRVETALREETQILDVLNRTGRDLASTLSLEAVLQAVTDAGREITGAKFGAFFYNTVDDSGASYQLYTLSGAPRSAFEHFGHPRATPVFRPTFDGGPVIRLPDVQQDPRYGQWGPHHGMPSGHLPVRSYLSVPVVSRTGEVIGGLFFGHPQPGVFTERSERLLLGVAAQAAVAVDNARLYAKAQRDAEERQRLLESEQAARALAERMSALKDDFLATLSHELRTPLSAILGWVHILRRGLRRTEDLDRAVETIDRSARAQVRLIDDLLDMNRITSGKVHLETQPLEPITFIDAALQEVAPMAQAKGVRLRHDLQPGCGPVAGDPGRLRQVVCNLLTNAIKFTAEGGSVHVLLRRATDVIEVTVLDTGAGIPPEFLPHVFERFRQADSSTTRRHGGLGLGLSIVKSLVELHGGEVLADSPGEGKGASFTVRLPVLRTSDRTTAAAPAAAPPHGAGMADLSGMRVLVVEDDDAGRDMLARILGEADANVVAVAGAREALAEFEARLPDAVVTDLGMPMMDGFQLLKALRRMQGARAVPVIALTAFARPQDRSRAMEAGFDAYLTKPFEAGELLQTVARLTARAARA